MDLKKISNNYWEDFNRKRGRCEKGTQECSPLIFFDLRKREETTLSGFKDFVVMAWINKVDFLYVLWCLFLDLVYLKGLTLDMQALTNMIISAPE